MKFKGLVKLVIINVILTALVTAFTFQIITPGTKSGEFSPSKGYPFTLYAPNGYCGGTTTVGPYQCANYIIYTGLGLDYLIWFVFLFVLLFVLSLLINNLVHRRK